MPRFWNWQAQWKTCTAQEHMMADVHGLSAQFFRVLPSKGAEFDPSPEHARGQVREDVHSSGKHFTTARGLALHRARAHQQFAPEHKLVCGATCPNCLRFLWLSTRLQQHLARIPRGGGGNRCYQALIEPGSATDFKAEKSFLDISLERCALMPWRQRGLCHHHSTRSTTRSDALPP